MSSSTVDSRTLPATIPPLSELVELHERASLTARPAPVACVAVNTRGLEEEKARIAIAGAEVAQVGVPDIQARVIFGQNIAAPVGDVGIVGVRAGVP